MNNKKSIDWGFLVLFLIFPLYLLPKVINKARQCDKAGIIALVLFFGILAFLIVPNYDATNHGHWAWNTFHNGMFWYYNNEYNDVYLVMLEYAVLSLGLEYHYVIYFTVLFSALPFWFLYYKVAYNLSSKQKTKMFVVFLLLFPFVNTMCGLRYFTAVSWLVYCNYKLMFCRDIKGAIFPLIIVLSIHFSMIIQVMVLLFAFITKIKQGPKITFAIIVVLCCLSVYIFNSLLPYLYAYFPSEKIEMYGDTEYMDVLDNQNLNFYISYWLKYSTWVPMMFVFLFLFYRKNYSYLMFPSFWCFLLLWAIGYGFTTLEYRFGRIAALFFFICFFIEGIRRNEISAQWYKLFVVAHSCRYFLEVYGMKSYLSISNHLFYLLILPYPVLLCIPYDHHVYDYIWQFYLRH